MTVEDEHPAGDVAPVNVWLEWALSCGGLGARWATYVRLAALADEYGVVTASRREIVDIDYGVSVDHLTNHLSWLRRHGFLEGQIGGIEMVRTEQLRLVDNPVDKRSSGPAVQRSSDPAAEGVTHVDLSSNETDSGAGPLDRWTHGDLMAALFDACGRPSTERERARYGRVARGFLDEGINPADVKPRADVLRRRWRQQIITVEALEKHWSSAVPESAPAPLRRFGTRRIDLDGSGNAGQTPDGPARGGNR